VSFSPAPTDVLTRVQEADALHQQAARNDIDAFVTYVMRDERTGLPIGQAPIHEAWHEMAELNERLLIWSHIESGKTNQLTIARPLFLLGQDPTLRIAVVSNTHEQAAKIVRSIAKYVTQSAELRRVFPKLQPDEPWTNSKLTVKRPYTSKDASIEACGVHGNIMGARLDLVILDDVLDPENCRTPGLRQDLWDWYHAAIAGRLTERAKVICVGTAYHPDDLLHRFARQGNWRAVRYPVLDDNGRSRWPSRWSQERIEKKRIELGPLEFARQMMCQARDDSEARFKKEWIDVATQLGEGAAAKYRNVGEWVGTRCTGLKVVPPGCKAYTGVDLAVQRHSSADLTVLFHLLLLPDKSRLVLDIEAGKWSGPQIVDLIADGHQRYKSLAIVENNAAQDFIIQFTRGRTDVPVKPFTTGRNKAHPEFGVESIAAEIAGGKWIIPSQGGRTSPEAAAWIQEMLFYDPQGHTGDRLMAAWFAREGIRMGSGKVRRFKLDLMSR
jgi:hypothetical protein